MSEPEQAGDMSAISIYQKLVNHFSEENLNTLCFTLNVEYDDLPPGPRNKARELVAYMGRQGRLRELQDAVTAALEARVPVIPRLQENFVERPVVMQEVLERLLAKEKFVAIVGAGGAGKTTLTTRLCHEEAIRKAFPDGVFWVELGPKLDAEQIFNRLKGLYKSLTPEPTQPIDLEDAKQKLTTALGNKQCLIVIDDVWNPAHLRPFLQGGEKCAYLVTTCRKDIALERDRSPIELDKMTLGEATELLLQRLDPKPGEILPYEQLAQRLGQWPLVLELTGRQLPVLMKQGYTPDGALKHVNEAHDREGPTAFDHKSDGRNADVENSLNISLDLLELEEKGARDYFRQLEVFPKMDIPLPAICTLWGSDEYETRKRLNLMDAFSLLKFSAHTIRLHDIIYEYLIFWSDSKAKEGLHKRLLDGYNPSHKPWHEVVESVLDYDYLKDHLIHHLICAKKDEDIHKLFETDCWAKLRRTEDLISDFGKARQFAHQPPRADLAIRIRYALFNEIVQQRYCNIPVEASPALLSNGTVAPTLLMFAMQTMEGDSADKTRAYLEIVSESGLSSTLQEDYAPHILRIAQGIDEPEAKARLTMELAAFLPNQFRHEAYRTTWQAIFEIESKELRQEILKELWAKLEEYQDLRKKLRKDALAIESGQRRIRVIYQIDQLLGEGQTDLWWDTIKSILKTKYDNNDAYTFATLIECIPVALRPMLEQKAGEAIWQALVARLDWEGGWGKAFAFIDDVLEALIPFVPAEHIHDAWKVAKQQHDLDIAEWSRVTVAASPHFPEELVPELWELADSMHWASYPARLLLASRLSTDEQAAESLNVWLSAIKEHHFYPVLGKLANHSEKQPETITWQIWQRTQPLLQELDRDEAKTVLSLLARIVPLTKIVEACDDCFQLKLRPMGTENMRAETIRLLIERLPADQQAQIWNDMLDAALKKYPLVDRRPHFAIEIAKQAPERWGQKTWGSILQQIRFVEASADRAWLLAQTVPNLPIQEQAQLWLETWSLSAVADKYNPWTQGELLKHLPHIYFHNRACEDIITQLTSPYEKAEALIDNDSVYASPLFRDHEVQAGLALLLLHAPQAFILNVWEKKRADLLSSCDSCWIRMPILPYLSPEEQQELLLVMFKSHRWPLPEIGIYLISNWPEEIIKRAWETLCATLADEDEPHNQYSYPNFAYALIPNLPESYRLTAWQRASKLIAPGSWLGWPEICETILRSLPDEAVPKAWEDLLAIERKYPDFRYRYNLARALAPRLAEGDLHNGSRMLVQPPKGNDQFSKTIFTCSLAQYLQRGGLFGVDLQGELKAHKYLSKIRILLQILLYLWSCLAYLFVPLLYLINLLFSGLKRIAGRIPGVKKNFERARYFYRLVRLSPWTHWFFSAAEFILVPIIVLFIPVLPFQEIVTRYALPKSQANEELEKLLLEEGVGCSIYSWRRDRSVTLELIQARPLIQRVGGAELRCAVADAYGAAQTWWKGVFLAE